QTRAGRGRFDPAPQSTRHHRRVRCATRHHSRGLPGGVERAARSASAPIRDHSGNAAGSTSIPTGTGVGGGLANDPGGIPKADGLRAEPLIAEPMADFHQNVVPTFTRLEGEDLGRMEKSLQRLARRVPIGVIIPTLFSDLSSPAMQNIIQQLAQMAFIGKIYLSLDRATAEEYGQAREIVK